MEVLLDRERAQFPATLDAVERERHRRTLQGQLSEVQTKIRELRLEESRLMRELGRAPDSSSGGKKCIPKILCACPGDTCKGFILTATGKCAACDVEVCRDCYVKLEPKTSSSRASGSKGEHVCRESDLATAKLIQSSCKPCPGCAVLIHRWTGCPMMFCTNCNTAFDWTTLEKLKHNRVHNPHYMEYLQRNGGRAAEGANNANNANGCDGLAGIPTPQILYQHLNVGVRDKTTNRIKPYYTQVELRQLLERQRSVLHMEDIELRRFNVTQQLPYNNEDLRVRYMMNDIDESTFKQTILEREQKREKMRATYEILEMYVRVGGDLIRRMLQTPARDRHAMLSIGREFDALNAYVLECFERQTKRFGSLRKPEMHHFALTPMS